MRILIFVLSFLLLSNNAFANEKCSNFIKVETTLLDVNYDKSYYLLNLAYIKYEFWNKSDELIQITKIKQRIIANK